ncbi:hypothetical protein PAPYR_8279 [Paratrimastix pyriformis]|uniref:Uncharacterized protein n=1 Tax=Paratrimastix pyriformis TaxID=342808 RepID=A0ABQ8UCE9_9EUKA|nr:hypothetical protein PAPYR_8279 [Paratrimastix pyriformis]
MYVITGVVTGSKSGRQHFRGIRVPALETSYDPKLSIRCRGVPAQSSLKYADDSITSYAKYLQKAETTSADVRTYFQSDNKIDD